MLTTKQLVNTCGIQKATLAKALGVSKSMVTLYAQGAREPSLGVASVLAHLTKMNAIVVSGAVVFTQKKRGRKAVKP